MTGSYQLIFCYKECPYQKSASESSHLISSLDTLSGKQQVFLVGDRRTHIQNLHSKEDPFSFQQEITLWKTLGYRSHPQALLISFPVHGLTVLRPKKPLTPSFIPFWSIDITLWRCCYHPHHQQEQYYQNRWRRMYCSSIIFSDCLPYI